MASLAKLSEHDAARPARLARAAVLIPTRRGGELLARVVQRVLEQRFADGSRPELMLADSGSPPAELERLAALGARIQRIPESSFDHGETRDLLASRTSAPYLVFLNQDALPVDDSWLARLLAPFESANPPAAVQGGIREFPEEELRQLGRARFYWDSCGPRFYFTRESEGWIARYDGIGFSTVNCAIARSAWSEIPFGRAAILEDKLWQKRAVERGWRIDVEPDAAVWHTHDYDLRALARRCVSEGFGWRLVGERYSLRAALTDLLARSTWRDWAAGRERGALRTSAERFFPVLRPLALWWGNRWAPRVLS